MSEKNMLVPRARQISVDDRMKFLKSLPETELHKGLSKLFGEMDKKAIVTITHGNLELGGIYY